MKSKVPTLLAKSDPEVMRVAAALRAHHVSSLSLARIDPTDTRDGVAAIISAMATVAGIEEFASIASYRSAPSSLVGRRARRLREICHRFRQARNAQRGVLWSEKICRQYVEVVLAARGLFVVVAPWMRVFWHAGVRDNTLASKREMELVEDAPAAS